MGGRRQDRAQQRRKNIPKVIFQMSSLRNFLEMRISSTRSFCRLANSVSFRPHILTPLMELSIVEVAEMRLSMASSHMA